MQKFGGISLIFMFVLSAILGWALDDSRGIRESATTPPVTLPAVRRYHNGEVKWLNPTSEQQQRCIALADSLTFVSPERNSGVRNAPLDYKRSGDALEILFSAPRLVRFSESQTASYDRCLVPLDQSIEPDSAKLSLFYGDQFGYASSPVVVKVNEPDIQTLISFRNRAQSE